MDRGYHPVAAGDLRGWDRTWFNQEQPYPYGHQQYWTPQQLRHDEPFNGANYQYRSHDFNHEACREYNRQLNYNKQLECYRQEACYRQWNQSYQDYYGSENQVYQDQDYYGNRNYAYDSYRYQGYC
jgi:hypothetical protein